ncbi:DUF4843 domain-containing protein [Butyricimonas sp.]|uniref:DUF4843 domain-containing protein n=1 Tax=Butyricimonas sp. TaxID=1969738 RepID=UPI0025BC08A0|nr:DUF4843 domain-containing protein [Butyricimonas sp.]
MKNILYFAVVLLLGAAACSKSEIPTWNEKPRVWFTKANDTTLFSFYSQPEGVEKYTVEIGISMAGGRAATERTVKIEDLGCTNDTSRYEISAVIPANQSAGVLRVTVYKTVNLGNAPDTIGFRICSSEDFEVGLNESLENALVISSKLTRPAWWDESAEYNLGYYSDKKMEVIMQVEGAFDILNAGGYSWYSDEIKVLIYKLNKYCKDNNVKYSEDDESVIEFDYLTK